MDLPFNRKRSNGDYCHWGRGRLVSHAKALNEQVNHTELFMELAPRADDLWFKAMAILNNTPTTTPTNKSRTPIPIIGSQRSSPKEDQYWCRQKQGAMASAGGTILTLKHTNPKLYEFFKKL